MHTGSVALPHHDERQGGAQRAADEYDEEASVLKGAIQAIDAPPSGAVTPGGGSGDGAPLAHLDAQLSASAASYRDTPTYAVGVDVNYGILEAAGGDDSAGASAWGGVVAASGSFHGLDHTHGLPPPAEASAASQSDPLDPGFNSFHNERDVASRVVNISAATGLAGSFVSSGSAEDRQSQPRSRRPSTGSSTTAPDHSTRASAAEVSHVASSRPASGIALLGVPRVASGSSARGPGAATTEPEHPGVAPPSRTASSLHSVAVRPSSGNGYGAADQPLSRSGSLQGTAGARPPSGSVAAGGMTFGGQQSAEAIQGPPSRSTSVRSAAPRPSSGQAPGGAPPVWPPADAQPPTLQQPDPLGPPPRSGSVSSSVHSVIAGRPPSGYRDAASPRAAAPDAVGAMETGAEAAGAQGPEPPSRSSSHRSSLARPSSGLGSITGAPVTVPIGAGHAAAPAAEPGLAPPSRSASSVHSTAAPAAELGLAPPSRSASSVHSAAARPSSGYGYGQGYGSAQGLDPPSRTGSSSAAAAPPRSFSGQVGGAGGLEASSRPSTGRSVTGQPAGGPEHGQGNGYGLGEEDSAERRVVDDPGIAPPSRSGSSSMSSSLRGASRAAAAAAAAAPNDGAGSRPASGLRGPEDSTSPAASEAPVPWPAPGGSSPSPRVPSASRPAGRPPSSLGSRPASSASHHSTAAPPTGSFLPPAGDPPSRSPSTTSQNRGGLGTPPRPSSSASVNSPPPLPRAQPQVEPQPQQAASPSLSRSSSSSRSRTASRPGSSTRPPAAGPRAPSPVRNYSNLSASRSSSRAGTPSTAPPAPSAASPTALPRSDSYRSTHSVPAAAAPRPESAASTASAHSLPRPHSSASSGAPPAPRPASSTTAAVASAVPPSPPQPDPRAHPGEVGAPAATLGDSLELQAHGVPSEEGPLGLGGSDRSSGHAQAGAEDEDAGTQGIEKLGPDQEREAQYSRASRSSHSARGESRAAVGDGGDGPGDGGFLLSPAASSRPASSAPALPAPSPAPAWSAGSPSPPGTNLGLGFEPGLPHPPHAHDTDAANGQPSFLYSPPSGSGAVLDLPPLLSRPATGASASTLASPLPQHLLSQTQQQDSLSNVPSSTTAATAAEGGGDGGEGSEGPQGQVLTAWGEQQQQQQQPAPQPHHLSHTKAQPKGPLDSCAAQSASEHVRTVWSTGNVCGIRSLPNALSPDFRERLYEELVQASHRERQGAAGGGAQGREFGRNANLSYGLEGGPMSVPLSVGQKQVARVHPLSGMFTQFEYLPSEYDRVKLKGKFERLQHRLNQTAPPEFVVRGPPAAPKGAPAFSEFSYAISPQETFEDVAKASEDVHRSKIVAGPFYPSGHRNPVLALRGRLDECMMGLCRQLSADWPTGFLQIFEDRNGSVVVSFDRSRAVAEGDVTSYMNTLAKRHHLVAAFHLLKDSTQWGLSDPGSGAVFYVMWPPWVRHRYLGPNAAAAYADAVRLAVHDSDSSEDEAEKGAGGGAGAGVYGMPSGGAGSGGEGALYGHGGGGSFGGGMGGGDQFGRLVASSGGY